MLGGAGGGKRKGSFAANARQGVGVLYRLCILDSDV